MFVLQAVLTMHSLFLLKKGYVSHVEIFWHAKNWQFLTELPAKFSTPKDLHSRGDSLSTSGMYPIFHTWSDRSHLKRNIGYILRTRRRWVVALCSSNKGFPVSSALRCLAKVRVLFFGNPIKWRLGIFDFSATFFTWFHCQKLHSAVNFTKIRSCFS
jgi:hypothetical protein